MDETAIDIALRLTAALLAGSLIGLERTFHGRPAGFRTHALVCLASALLMLMTAFQWEWLETPRLETIRADPTRMAQGIMTGIGFLGAGVIFKEGLTVRGLTTAASIWMTAALGILYGVGFYLPALAGTIATLGILAVFRWIEDRLPRESFSHVSLRFATGQEMNEAEIRDLFSELGFEIADIDYRQNRGLAQFEYRVVTSSLKRADTARLAEKLKALPDVIEFRIQSASE